MALYDLAIGMPVYSVFRDRTVEEGIVRLKEYVNEIKALFKKIKVQIIFSNNTNNDISELEQIPNVSVVNNGKNLYAFYARKSAFEHSDAAFFWTIDDDCSINPNVNTNIEDVILSNINNENCVIKKTFGIITFDIFATPILKKIYDRVGKTTIRTYGEDVLPIYALTTINDREEIENDFNFYNFSSQEFDKCNNVRMEDLILYLNEVVRIFPEFDSKWIIKYYLSHLNFSKEDKLKLIRWIEKNEVEECLKKNEVEECCEFYGFNIINDNGKLKIIRCFPERIIYKFIEYNEFNNIDFLLEKMLKIKSSLNGQQSIYCKKFNKFCGLPGKIDYVRVSISQACNACCDFCGLRKTVDYNNLQLQKELYFKTLYSLKGKIKSLSLTDCGEPFYYLKEMKEFFKSLKKEDFELIFFSSNGTLIDDELIEIIKKCPVKIEGNISLNATNKEDYKKIVGLDCFDKVVDNIKKLNKVCNYFTISFIYYEPLFNKLYTLKKDLKTLGLENIIIYVALKDINPKYETPEYKWWIKNN